MRLISIDQLMKKSKAVLIRKITQHLRSMPKKRIAMLYYEMSKFGLLKLRKTKQKALPKHKTKRKTKKIVGKIYYTKKGQPYKILASGKARFVKR